MKKNRKCEDEIQVFWRRKRSIDEKKRVAHHSLFLASYSLFSSLSSTSSSIHKHRSPLVFTYLLLLPVLLFILLGSYSIHMLSTCLFSYSSFLTTFSFHTRLACYSFLLLLQFYLFFYSYVNRHLPRFLLSITVSRVLLIYEYSIRLAFVFPLTPHSPLLPSNSLSYSPSSFFSSFSSSPSHFILPILIPFPTLPQNSPSLTSHSPSSQRTQVARPMRKHPQPWS